MLGTNHRVVAGKGANHVALLVENAEVEVHRLKHSVMQARLFLNTVTVGRDVFGAQRQVGNGRIETPAGLTHDAARIAGAIPGG